MKGGRREGQREKGGGGLRGRGRMDRPALDQAVDDSKARLRPVNERRERGKREEEECGWEGDGNLELSSKGNIFRS